MRSTPQSISTFTISLCLALCSLVARGDDNASVQVDTAAVEMQTLSATLLTFGTVEADPEHLIGISSAYAGQISQLWITPGQPVNRGDPLLKIDTDPAARLTYIQAVVQADYARQELVRLQELRREQLATNAELASAEQAVMDADAALATQKKLGTQHTERIVRAAFDGMVNSISVAVSDRIQPGIPLLQIAQRDRLLIGLGIEPADVTRVKAGMAVTLVPVFDPEKRIECALASVHARVDEATGLVNATVRLRNSHTAALLHGMRVQGIITLERSESLVVPRSAVLTDDKGDYVYKLAGETAHRIDVRTGIEEDSQIAVAGDLQLKDVIVVTGNYELADGMRVRIGEP